MSLPAAVRLACLCLISLIISLPPRASAAGAGEAPSGDAGMARCAAITEPGARLACFDALAAATANRGEPARGQPAAPLLATAPTTTASAPAPAATVAPTAPTAAAAPAAATAGDVRTFGFSPAQLQPISSAPSSIKAHVAAIALGLGRPTIVLDNGQSWAFSEPLDDPRLGPGATVTIKRAALGSFLLMTASQHAYHVHRIQ